MIQTNESNELAASFACSPDEHYEDALNEERDDFYEDTLYDYDEELDDD